MAKKQKIQMPAGIRNKLMAAVSMLLVSSIMMVSTTYAWFTLSTAPEVTGITTSVGANGNLEMALLTSETFTDLNKITSGVGNSSATSGVEKANITWGNLIDLSSMSYGLADISLAPAALNAAYNEEKIDEEIVKTLKSVSVVNPLFTANYGADGRVTDATGNTVTAIKDASSKFTFGDTQTYGVRAIGTTSNLSAREIALRNAKSVVNATSSSAKRGTVSAISNNLSALVKFANASGAPTEYTATDIAAFIEITNGIISDIATLENAYKNALIAKAATTAESDEAFAVMKTTIEALTLDDLANQTAVKDFTLSIGNLATAQTNAVSALNTLNKAKTNGTVKDTEAQTENETKVKVSEVNAAIKLLVGSPTTDSSDEYIVIVYIASGSVGELANQIGKFELASVKSLGAAYAGSKESAATGTFNDSESGIVTTVSALTMSESASAESNITDTYGYIIDFAFRTNASGSNLQLQTTPINRVYQDQDVQNTSGLITQGNGSTVTYTFAPGMTETQANKLLNAIKLVFLSTDTGDVYATAGLTDIKISDTEATANVKIDGQQNEVGTIVALEQNNAKKVSVLVYMDGEQVDNSAVINAESSGTLKLNLQFSSSAKLVPMNNTALKTMQLTYTAMQLTGNKYTFGGTEYTLKTGYTLYKGNDGKVYYAETPTGDAAPNCVELTASNYTTVLETEDTASVDGQSLEGDNVPVNDLPVIVDPVDDNGEG